MGDSLRILYIKNIADSFQSADSIILYKIFNKIIQETNNLMISALNTRYYFLIKKRKG